MKPILSQFRRMPHGGAIVVLTTLAGLSEGFGLALFVPLTAVLTGEGGRLPPPFSLVMPTLEKAGLAASPAVLLIVIVVAVLASLGLVLVQRNLVSRAQYRFAQDLRTALFTAAMESRWSYLSRQASGEALANLVQAAERAGSAMHHYGLFIGGVVLLLIYGTLSAVLSWQLLLLSVAVGILLVLGTRPLMRRASMLGRKMTDEEEDYTFQAVDWLRGAKLAKVTGSEQSVIRAVVDIGEHVSVVKIASQYNANMLNFVLQAGPTVLVAAAIAVGALVLGLPASLLLAFLLVMGRIAPKMAATQHALQAYLVNVPALQQVDRRITEFRAEAEPIEESGLHFQSLREGLVLKGVGYLYADGDAAAVEDVSIEFPCNRMIALVGPSGAGKSTLMEIIAGIRAPTSGRVVIDGTDLAAMAPRSWRRRIGYVTQDTILFNDTLRANLLFSQPDANDNALRKALAVAHLEDLLASLPDGLDTVLGEGGVRLSGGQRQRVALARALVGEPQVLLLDEATSSLDNESERYIQQALEDIAHTMTIVVIAHRLSTVRRADMIHVIEDGRIVESGDYDDLTHRSGRFAALHDAQFA